MNTNSVEIEIPQSSVNTQQKRINLNLTEEEFNKLYNAVEQSLAKKEIDASNVYQIVIAIMQVCKQVQNITNQERHELLVRMIEKLILTSNVLPQNIKDQLQQLPLDTVITFALNVAKGAYDIVVKKLKKTKCWAKCC